MDAFSKASASRVAGSEDEFSPPLPPPATAPSELQEPRAKAAAAPRQPARLPVLICFKINRYLAPDATPHLLHRVAEGGPVTYVFLGHTHALPFHAFFNRGLVSLVQVPRQHAALPKPPADDGMQESNDQPAPHELPNDTEDTQAETPSQPPSAEDSHKKDNIACDHALASEAQSPQPDAVHEVSVQHQPSMLISALILKEDWLDMILSGRKTWEIRSRRTTKRERVALALSGTSLLLRESRDC